MDPGSLTTGSIFRPVWHLRDTEETNALADRAFFGGLLLGIAVAAALEFSLSLLKK